MGIETESRMIRGTQVYTTKLPCRRSLKLLPKLLKIAAPALSKLEGQDLTDLENVDVAEIAPAFGEFFLKLDESDAEGLAELILERTVVKTKLGMLELNDPENIDRAFEDLGTFLGAMWFALEVNFKGFFADASAMRGALSKAGASE